MRCFIPNILARVLSLGVAAAGFANANAEPPSENWQTAETETNPQAEFGWHFAGIRASTPGSPTVPGGLE